MITGSPDLVDERRERRDRFLRLLGIPIGAHGLRIVIVHEFDWELGVGIRLAEFRAPAKGDPGGFRRITIDRRELARRGLAELYRVDLADVGSGASRIRAIHAINRKSFADKERQPAFAAVGRGVVDPRGMPASGIKQDGIGIAPAAGY